MVDIKSEKFQINEFDEKFQVIMVRDWNCTKLYSLPEIWSLKTHHYKSFFMNFLKKNGKDSRKLNKNRF